MSNGYVVAAAADLVAAHEIADGFGLDVIDASSVHDLQTASAALGEAANVGILLSSASAQDTAFIALLQSMATRVGRAQLILVSADAQGAFPFLPSSWPTMSLADARARAAALARQRGEPDERAEAPLQAAPLPSAGPPEPEGPPSRADEPPPAEHAPAPGAATELDASTKAPDALIEDELVEAQEQEGAPAVAVEPDNAVGTPESEAPRDQDAQMAEPPPRAEPPDVAPEVEPQAPPEPAPAAPDRAGDRWAEQSDLEMARRTTGATAPADATAFAPSKLRRGTPELVRIVVHHPKDLNAVIKAAKKIDPRTEAAPQGMGIGNVALGASIGVALEVRGGACEGTVQRRLWLGEPIDFNFAVEAEATVKQVVMLARVFIDDAQIGVLAFTRKVSGPAKKPHGPGDRARLKRHKRVFLSYSSQDRETVAQIATAYQIAGVEHFWDRASLKSGEEWSPRLRREIDRADLFHLCWSKSAAQSAWVAKEAEHALTRRRKHSGKPDITVQMLDGPPWAPHPPELDSINFDDFVRAAIVGYARGDGS